MYLVLFDGFTDLKPVNSADVKKSDNIWNRIGKTFKQAMKNYVRGMPEEKIFIRPSSKKYIHLPKRIKTEENKKTVRRLIYRKELQ